MLKNNRGEVFTLTVVILAALAAFVIGSSSKWGNLVGIGSKEQKSKQVYTSKSESKPIIVTGQDGKQYILQATKTETSTLDMAEEVKMTLWQKLLMLPKLWLGLMILGIFFPPVAGIMSFINARLKGAAAQIINGVEKGLATIPQESKDKVLTELSKTYDKSTKVLVSKIKQK